jgi:hypothetical protein
MSSTAAAGKKEKGNLTGKKETIIVNGRSLFVVGHYHDARLSCPGDSGELFPFPILLVFSFLAVATRQRVRVIPLWLCVFYTVWMSLLLRTAQQSRALTYFFLISIPFCFNPSHLKIPHLILQLPFII